ncbi:ABC transporter permease [Clostridium sp. DL1XJH146]
MKKRINIGRIAISLFFQLLLIFIWQLVVDNGVIERYSLPSPTDVIQALINMFPEVNIHLIITLREAMLGFGIAIVLSLILAVFMDQFKTVRDIIYPILVISQTVPVIVLAPLFGIWFGLGLLPKVIVVVLVCFFPILISLMDGLDSVDKDMVNLLKSMGASKVQIFKKVKFPASLTNFFSGLRIAATYSIMGAVIGEWLGGYNGLGLYMLRLRKSFAIDKVFAVVIIIVVLSMTLFGIIYLLQYLFMPWSRKENI